MAMADDGVIVGATREAEPAKEPSKGKNCYGTGNRYECSVEGCGKWAVKHRLCKGHGAHSGETCAYEGCANKVVNRGLCLRHGAKNHARVCRRIGCDTHAVEGGLCIKHGATRRGRPCRHEGCKRNAQVGGYCYPHSGRKRPVHPCRVEGCTQPSYAKSEGLCERHGIEQGVYKRRKYKCKVRQCTHEGCTNQVVNSGVCRKHGAVVPGCSREGCTNLAHSNGVCLRHAGWTTPECRHEGCTLRAQRRGFCKNHGGGPPECSAEGCTNASVKGGVCVAHGAQVARQLCRHEGCTNVRNARGLCSRHGGKREKRQCSREGCTKLSKSGGMCWRHSGKRPPRCTHDGCTNQGLRRGLCVRHYRSSSSRRVKDSIAQHPGGRHLGSAWEAYLEEASEQAAAGSLPLDSESSENDESNFHVHMGRGDNTDHSHLDQFGTGNWGHGTAMGAIYQLELQEGKCNFGVSNKSEAGAHTDCLADADIKQDTMAGVVAVGASNDVNESSKAYYRGMLSTFTQQQAHAKAMVHQMQQQINFLTAQAKMVQGIIDSDDGERDPSQNMTTAAWMAF